MNALVESNIAKRFANVRELRCNLEIEPLKNESKVSSSSSNQRSAPEVNVLWQFVRPHYVRSSSKMVPSRVGSVARRKLNPVDEVAGDVHRATRRSRNLRRRRSSTSICPSTKSRRRATTASCYRRHMKTSSTWLKTVSGCVGFVMFGTSLPLDVCYCSGFIFVRCTKNTKSWMLSTNFSRIVAFSVFFLLFGYQRAVHCFVPSLMWGVLLYLWRCSRSFMLVCCIGFIKCVPLPCGRAPRRKVEWSRWWCRRKTARTVQADETLAPRMCRVRRTP